MNSIFYSQAEVFVEIVRQGSVTGAAKALRISKSNASQKLVDMEKSLDVVLFHRTTRSMRLTPAGQEIFDRCVKAVDSVAFARSEIGFAPATGDLSGVVNIAGPNIYLTQFVLPNLEPFQKQFPDIKVNLIGSDQPVDQGVNNVDLRFRVGPKDSSGARVYPLKPLDRILCISSKFEAAIKNIEHPSKLEALPAVLRKQEPPVWKFQNAEHSYDYHIQSPRMIVNSYELCVQAVRSGLGMAVIARSVIEEDLVAGSLVELLPAWKLSTIPASLLVRYPRLRKPHVLATASFLHKHMTK